MKRKAESGSRKIDSGSGDRKVRPAYRNSPALKESWRGPIERLAWGGKGVGHAEDGRLLLLEAPLALFPGEVVEAQVIWRARHGEGRVTRWITRDPRRAPAACPVAETCGGCDLWEAGRHAPELKRLMAADLLRRQLGEGVSWAWHPAPESARRHRIQLHWDGTDLGYFQRHSHVLVPISACPAATDPLSEAIPRLHAALTGQALPFRPGRWELSTGSPAQIVWATDERGRTWQLEPDGWHRSAEPIRHRLGEATLQHEPGAFFQVSAPWAAEAFGGLLGSWDLKGDTLFDLYGGVGLFSLLLGDRFRRRVLVESGETAVAWARRNLAAAGLPSECLVADVAAWVPEGLGEAGDLILLDPPRAGLEPALCDRLLGAGARSLVLVGCDGAAFCRDLKRLAGAWNLEQLAVLDLFPLTTHVECVALLSRRP
ncbi:MAG: class I SAM-dependent RNA methyltransferase [Holophagaceae bacterium]|uniref:Class I SAM-dependent RNA methyltransferase n=1 Tax=Candidatus Geothrix skivensis TaxID=2954439 RepID=A0A9D7SGW5_9BACT|nr:class I SAM-dependent RNA methyltransferase [Candidatus Geothrix skivensis]